MKPILIIISVLFLCCCSHKDSEVTKDINLLVSPSADIINISEIASDIEYVPLETVDNSLIRNIYDIKASDEKIYINTQTELICFDRNGKYLYKINNVGRGPNEYNFIYDFDIYPKKGFLLILVQKKILIYSEKENGFELYKSLSFKNQPSLIDLIPSQDKILLSYRSASGIEPLQNMIVNLTGDTLRTRNNFYLFKKTSNSRFAVANDNIVVSNGDHLCFKGILSDTIFSVDQSNNIKPYLILNSAGHQLTADDFKIHDNILSLLSERLIVYEIMEVPRYLIYNFSYNKTLHTELYDKTLNKKYNIPEKAAFINDITGGPRIELKFAYNQMYYSWIDAFTFKKCVTSVDFDKASVKDINRKLAVEKLANSIKETDNQILIVIRPKI